MIARKPHYAFAVALSCFLLLPPASSLADSNLVIYGSSVARGYWARDQFGNIVTNIPKSLVDDLGLSPEDGATVTVEITQSGKPVFRQQIPYVSSFGYVDQGSPLLYSDSLQTIGLAINSGNFAEQYKVRAGADWTIRLAK